MPDNHHIIWALYMDESHATNYWVWDLEYRIKHHRLPTGMVCFIYHTLNMIYLVVFLVWTGKQVLSGVTGWLPWVDSRGQSRDYRGLFSLVSHGIPACACVCANGALIHWDNCATSVQYKITTARHQRTVALRILVRPSTFFFHLHNSSIIIRVCIIYHIPHLSMEFNCTPMPE